MMKRALTRGPLTISCCSHGTAGPVKYVASLGGSRAASTTTPSSNPLLGNDARALERAWEATRAADRIKTCRPDGLKVTDLTATSWCEQKYAFDLQFPELRVTNAAMQRGTDYHLSQEEALYEVQDVTVDTPQQLWSYRMLGNVVALTLLPRLGVARELWLFGRVLKVWVRGILDELYLVPIERGDGSGAFSTSSSSSNDPTPAGASPSSSSINTIAASSSFGSISSVVGAKDTSNSTAAKQPRRKKGEVAEPSDGVSTSSSLALPIVSIGGVGMSSRVADATAVGVDEFGGAADVGSITPGGSSGRSSSTLLLREIKTTGSASLSDYTKAAAEIQLMLYRSMLMDMQRPDFAEDGLPTFWGMHGVDADSALPPLVLEGLRTALAGALAGSEDAPCNGSGFSLNLGAALASSVSQRAGHVAENGRGSHRQQPAGGAASTKLHNVRTSDDRSEGNGGTSGVNDSNNHQSSSTISIDGSNSSGSSSSSQLPIPRTLQELTLLVLALLRQLPDPSPIMEVQGVNVRDGQQPTQLKPVQVAHDDAKLAEHIRTSLMFWRGHVAPRPARFAFKCKSCEYNRICPKSLYRVEEQDDTSVAE